MSLSILYTTKCQDIQMQSPLTKSKKADKFQQIDLPEKKINQYQKHKKNYDIMCRQYSDKKI